MVLAATLALTSFACQSAEQRQAHELREALLEVTPLLWTVYGFRIKPHLSASIHS